MNDFNNTSMKEKLLNLWYNYKKYVILISVVIILLLIVLLAVLIKGKNTDHLSNNEEYETIESVMSYSAKNYMKNNDISTDNIYIVLNYLNIEIDSSLKCNSNSGVLVQDNKYIPYLICENYNSNSIQDIIDSNSKIKYASLEGDNPYVINGNYIEKGIDVEEGYTVNIKNNTIDNGVNIVTYNILKDGSYITDIKRIVIAEGILGSSPVIELVGNSTRTLDLNSTYIESGYIATDKMDGNITSKVKVAGSVDTTKAGTYTLTYSVTNSKGKTTSTKRKIIVNSSDTNLVITSSVSGVINDTVKIALNIEGSGYQYTVLDNGEKSTSKNPSYIAHKDGIYEFVIYDTNDNSEAMSITVNKFSLLKPTITSITSNGVMVEVSASSPNGIAGYLFSKTSTIPTGKEENWVLSTSNTLEVAKYAGKYYVFVKDAKNQFSDYKEIEITMSELYDKSPKSRIYDYYLTEPIEQFLNSRGDSIDNLNNFVATSVLSAGLFTRDGVVTSAVAVLNYLYQKHGVQIPYFSNIQCSGTRYYKYFGANPRWGVAMNKQKCNYAYVGLDCASFVGWAIHNGGFQGENTIGSYSSQGATITRQCNEYSEKRCIRLKSKSEMYTYYQNLKYGDTTSSDDHVILVLEQYDDDNDGKMDGIYILESNGGAGIKKFSWEWLYRFNYYIFADMTNMYSNTKAHACQKNAPIPEAWSRYQSLFNDCEIS